MRKKNRMKLLELIDYVMADTEGTSLIPVLQSYRAKIVDGFDDGKLLAKMSYNIQHISLNDRNVNSDHIYDLVQFIEKNNIWHDLGKRLVKAK